MQKLTKTQIIALPTEDLRAIVRSTNPDGDLKIELSWARDELERRQSRQRA
jgi:hypothetical protein